MNVSSWDREKIFEKIFLEGPFGIALVGLDYRFLEVNPALCEMLGYSQDELKKLSFPDITYPEDLSLDLQLAEQLFQGTRKNYQIEKRYIKKNGQVFWIQLAGSVIRDDGGNPLYAVAMITDLTEVFSRRSNPQSPEDFILNKKSEYKIQGPLRSCSWCKRVHYHNEWMFVEKFIKAEMDLAVSHGICEDCYKTQAAEEKTT